MTKETKVRPWPATPGERIQSLRKRERMSQEDLADAAEISTTYLSEIENGRRTNIGMQVLSRLASALNASTDWIIFGDPDG